MASLAVRRAASDLGEVAGSSFGFMGRVTVVTAVDGVPERAVGFAKFVMMRGFEVMMRRSSMLCCCLEMNFNRDRDGRLGHCSAFQTQLSARGGSA